MGDKKWEIGSVQIGGNAMFGDHNRMVINEAGLKDLTVYATNPKEVKRLLVELSDAVTNTSEEEADQVTPEQQATAQAALSTVVEEIRTPTAKRTPDRLKRALDSIVGIAKTVPTVLKTALQLKTLLGF